MDTNMIIGLIIVLVIVYYYYTSSSSTSTAAPASSNNMNSAPPSSNNMNSAPPSSNNMNSAPPASNNMNSAPPAAPSKNIDHNWYIFKGNSSYVVARNNTDTKSNVLYECLATDGKNCYWKQSYDAAMNDLKNPPPNINTVSGNWTDLVKLTGPPAPAPWKVCAHPSGTFVVARDDTSTFQKSSECVATDGANCFWRNDRDTATNDLNNLPSPMNPVKGDWGLTC